MTFIKRKYAERNRIYKKKDDKETKIKKRRRRIREQRGAREECSEKSRRKEEKNASAFPFRRDDGKKNRDFLFPTHISSLPRRRRAIPILCGSLRCCCRYSLFLPSAFISVVFQRPFPGSESDSNLFLS